MFKGIKTAIAVALSIGGLGTAVTLSAVAAAPKEEHVAYAAAFTGGEEVYLKPNSNWLSNSARFAVYYFKDGGSNGWIDMSKVNDGLNIYKTTIPSGTWDGIIFCRMNGGTTANNWDNKWNQSEDVKDYGESKLRLINDGAWDKSSKWYETKTCVVSGDFNGWSTTADQMVFDPANYQYDGTFTTTSANSEFKVVFDGSWKGCENVDSGVNSNYIDKSAGGDSNIKAVISGDYEVYYKPYEANNKLIWAQISSSTEADNYATTFLNAIACDSTGRTAPVLSTSWSDLKTAFDALTIGAQGKLKVATPSESGTNIQKCAARYDYIVGKYGTSTYADFMERSPAPIGSAKINLNTTNNNSVYIIVVVASAVAISFGAFFLLRKKRKQY